jgi:ribosome recycling factor
MAMIKNILEDAQHRMDQTLVHTRMELGKVRTGRANPELLDGIPVSYYGTMTPLNQVANISVSNPQIMSILPYEKALIPDIEKAILESNIGLTPSNNGIAVKDGFFNIRNQCFFIR